MNMLSRKILHRVICGALLVFAVSCTAEKLTDDPNRVITSGQVQVSLHIDVPDMEKVETRATDENKITTLHVMAFDASDRLTDTPQQAIITGSGASTKYFATLQATTQSRTVYVIANAATAITNFGTWTVGTTTLATVKTGLKMPDLATTTNITVQPSLLAMVGEKSLPLGITSTTIISNDGTIANPLPLVRATAKITVKVDDSTAPGFTISGATLIHAPNNSGALSQVTPSSLKNYSNNTTTLGMIAGTGADNLESAPLYCYESAKANKTSVVISTNKGFYRLDLIDKTSRLPIDINRNTHYMIKITKIDNVGYSKADEAAANPPSNIEYDIIVTDPNSHDIVSNGQYFLGVSHSELIVYNDQAIQNNLAGLTITHNAPTTVTTATVAVTGIGLTIATSTGLTGTGATATLTTRDGAKQTIGLNINMAATFTAGKITISLGNLTKDITVTRKPALSAIGGLLTDFNNVANVKGDIENSGGWLTISPNADGSNPSSSSVVSPAGGIYPILGSNTPTLGGTIRTGAVFYVSRNDDKGRTKVIASQGFINIGTPPAYPLPYPYVGAFWRANQTGERLIRMPVNASTLGAWTATVMDGVDWVVLDTNPTSDGGVNWTNASATPADMNAADATYRVSGSVTSVSGTAVAATDYIYFRIGLKSTHTPTTTAPARYARVAVSYKNNTQLQVLFLRQGEEADYVMRPNDVNNTGVAIADNRSFARKFSPYNLTATTLDTQVAVQGGTFTAYPTQAGAFWQWSGYNTGKERIAYNPITSVVGWVPPYVAYWDKVKATNETCPAGYRRPTDGTINGEVFSGSLASSEMRQSLYWNSHPAGNGNVDNPNAVFGYYADGYFDRRTITNGFGIDKPGINSSVSTTTYLVAHTGRLYYNPTTRASIFFPAPGCRYSGGGELYNAGSFGYYWSSSATVTYGWSWYLHFYNLNASQNRSVPSYGFSIRCVKSDPPILRYVSSVAGAGATALSTWPTITTAASISPGGGTYTTITAATNASWGGRVYEGTDNSGAPIVQKVGTSPTIHYGAEETVTASAITIPAYIGSSSRTLSFYLYSNEVGYDTKASEVKFAQVTQGGLARFAMSNIIFDGTKYTFAEDVAALTNKGISL